jgi:ABC-type nitrate/sulfonate/bicarbonate transport system substrate-binding protein
MSRSKSLVGLRAVLALGIVVAVTAVLAATGGASGRAKQPTLELKAPTALGTAVYSQLWIAQQEGFFAAHNLKVDFVTAPITTSLLLASLESGQINVWLNGVGGVGGALQNGHPNQFFCGQDNGQEQALMVRADSTLPVALTAGLQAAAQALKGKTIGVPSLGGQSMLDTITALNAGGVAQGDVNWVATGAAATTIAALQSGQVDAVLTYAGLTHTLITTRNGKMDILFRRDVPIFKNYIGAAWAAPTSVIQSNPAALKAFCAGIEDATKWAVDPKNAQALLQVLETQMDFPTAHTLIKSTYFRHLDWRVGKTAMANAITTLTGEGILKPGLAFGDIVWSGAPTAP